MNQLPLEQLKFYLETDLMLVRTKDQVHIKLQGINKDKIICMHSRVLVVENIANIKPIVRPLKDLTEEIEVNGEKFYPVLKIIEDAYDLTLEDNFTIDCGGNVIIDSHDEFSLALPDILKHVNMLCAWHFDVFGWIDEGIAVDINQFK